MKKLTAAFAAILVVSAALLITINLLNAGQGYSGKNTLTVFNWGDYIDTDLIKQFEKETGIKVIYETFDSNEAMLTKIEQGGTSYDISVPSEYAIAKMKSEGLIQKIDKSKIPNLKTIDPRFLNLSFDEGNEYSVPYFWGTVGIVYNPKRLGMEITSWNDLWKPELKNKILLIDGAREEVGMALNSLGYSLNDTNPAHLEQAKQKLYKLTPNVKAIVGDEIKTLMINNEAEIAVVWSGDAAEIMWENEEMDYVVPKEGSNLWFDNMVIPSSAKNIEGAHKFINFLLDPKNNAQNTEYVGYATPNKEALALLPEEIRNDKRFYPDAALTDRLEVYKDLGKKNLGKYNEIFLEFKMH